VSVADTGDHNDYELRVVAYMKDQNGGDKWSAVDTGGHKGSENVKKHHSYTGMKNVFATCNTSFHRKTFPRPSLNMVNKNLILTPVQ
jgi:hypothetical protein